ncbi:MAG: hypothetical protein ACE5I1_12590, partial [bacterium]
NELNTTISKKTINWWGDDPDGIIEGFIYTFDENAPDVESWDSNSPAQGWTFTEKTQEVFTLTLSGTDTIYTFRVKAVDDDGAADPTAAVRRFPVMNSRPQVEFILSTDVPETTFTVAAFNWKGTDLDGDDTIAKYQYALEDTANPSAWIDLDANASSLVLTANDGLTEGEHVLYLRAIDIAGASSSIARMPRDENDFWYVREPKSKFLLLDDYNIADNTGAFYASMLRTIVGEIDVWDIKSRAGALEPASPQAFRQTLLLFDRVFWYADTDPNLGKAQVSVLDFLENGGKLIMTTSFKEFTSNIGDPLAFSPVDSLGAKISRITRNQVVQATPEFAATGFPDLKVSAVIIPNIFPLAPKISSRPMYVLPENPGRWSGTPVVGVIDGTSSFVFFGLPLSALDSQGTAQQVIEKILNEVFAN